MTRAGDGDPGGCVCSGSDVVARLRAAGCVFAEAEARELVSAARSPAHLHAMVVRRAAGEPLEHVLGWVDFCGRRIAVDAGVFVPRRRTELLVREALAVLASTAGPAGRAADRRRAVVVELCCGSGAVSAALCAALPGVEIHAVDIDAAAVQCAQRNLAGTGALVYEGDLYEPLPPVVAGRVDVVVANAPYVPSHAIGRLPPEARDHEPRVALDGGADGLAVQRRIIGAAPRWLATEGHVLVETSTRQAPATVDALVRSGLASRVVTSEEPEAVVVVGRAGGGTVVSEP